jgi:AraC family transcriptional regulator of adaptative response / DNA-3-methyladenine glycosylase II
VSSYSAVVTTGIYCRPGCSARPHAHNVRTFELASAAEAAGFRPCMRCRPYRTSQPIGTVGPELVCRAVQLILDGALDEGTEEQLAQRLAVSSRHLRRLFTQNVGATPDQVARSRRAHFARRLLDDTDLTVTEIAFASGFGSVRQLNRACKEVFRAAPLELRAKRRSADRLVADGGLLLRLPYTPPLDWPAMLRYFRRRAIAGVEAVDGDTYRRTIVVDGDPGVLEVSQGGDDYLLLLAHLPHWEGLIHVVQRARRVFDLDADLDAVTAGLHDDELVGPLVERAPGLRVPGTWDPFEIGVRAIVGQQISVQGANTLMARLVERHGTPVPGLAQLGLSRLFPEPATLAVADLADLGLTTRRQTAVRELARAVSDRSVLLDRSVGLDQLVASIAAVPGLGGWTANYIAMRLGEADGFPAADLGLRRAVADANVPSARELALRAEHWRPWRAYAAVHLWTLLEIARRGPAHEPMRS